MTRLGGLAVGVSALAGYVDAIGFIHLGGYFLSSMSANTTILGVGLAEHAPGAAVAAGLMTLFVLGVVAGSIVVHRAQSYPRTAVILLAGLLLLVAAGLNAFSIAHAPIAAMALAMGAANCVFERDRELNGWTLSATAPLVALGEHLSDRIAGERRQAWARPLSVWLAFVTGALAGAAAYQGLSLGAIWIAVVAAAILALIAASIERARGVPLT
jgi:uncharacterized membrane protein YoaK (UPF0700 family)